MSNLNLVNPEVIENKEIIKLAFKLRRILNPLNLITTVKIVGLEYFKKYVKDDLSIKEIEGRMSELFGCNFKLIKISDPFASLDVDTIWDYKRLRRLFRYRGEFFGN